MFRAFVFDVPIKLEFDSLAIGQKKWDPVHRISCLFNIEDRVRLIVVAFDALLNRGVDLRFILLRLQEFDAESMSQCKVGKRYNEKALPEPGGFRESLWG
jgi:hypothetical protein